MKNYIPLLIFVLSLTACAQKDIVTKNFTEEALSEAFFNLDNSEVTLKTILKQNAGKLILIDVWASWCRDCVIGMPKVKTLQMEHPEMLVVFLSLDTDIDSWKNGIENFGIQKGEHFLVSKGWKGDFATSINLDWIPRYMVVNPKGEITLYRAVKADDPKLIDTINSK